MSSEKRYGLPIQSRVPVLVVGSRLTAKRPSAQHPFARRSRGHSGLGLPSWHRALAAPRPHWRHAAAAASPQSQLEPDEAYLDKEQCGEHSPAASAERPATRTKQALKVQHAMIFIHPLLPHASDSRKMGGAGAGRGRRREWRRRAQLGREWLAVRSGRRDPHVLLFPTYAAEVELLGWREVEAERAADGGDGAPRGNGRAGGRWVIEAETKAEQAVEVEAEAELLGQRMRRQSERLRWSRSGGRQRRLSSPCGGR
uniref:Uncharacterized protein n=1 Tax=Oryza barthii TaxID=65489 RepID=A0A0D3GPL4_9ORYZ